MDKTPPPAADGAAETEHVSTPIEDYALIGDCYSAALVSKSGSIDWLCWPRFDDDACFAALLGTPDHGRWLIAPDDAEARATRSYRDGSVVLETVFKTPDGEVALIDFMPIGGSNTAVARLVEGRRGRVAMRMEMALRFSFGADIPWVTRLKEGGGISAIAGPHQAILRTPVELEGVGMSTVALFTVGEGERVPFLLDYAPSYVAAPAARPVEALLEDTERFWMEWSGRCKLEGPHREAVKRSLITLKALTFAPSGGIVAAPTTSLPEEIGGMRNWDYRFCWLRDATITLLAFMQSGYYDEAQAWRDWLHRSVAGSPDQLQIMYGITGERRLVEWEVGWLPGYANSKPVRIGNAAHEQVQLDVYGEMIDALHLARVGGLSDAEDGWALQVHIVEHLEKIWNEPDEGIWETRGGPRHFTFSKMMAWVAFDRSIRSAEQFGLEAPTDRWTGVRDAIHASVCAHGFDTEKDSFVQSYGSKELDASLLLIPVLGFLPPEDPRVRSTLAAVERELLSGGFVLRYRTETGGDGLPAGEGAFLACSFWLVDSYVMQGRVREARALFDRLLALCNDVGLLSEEYDPRLKRQVGNFPQAFSHVALINSAIRLSRAATTGKQERGADD